MSIEKTYNLSYSARDENTRSSIMDLNISFENPSTEDLKEKLNIWLSAIGADCKVS